MLIKSVIVFNTIVAAPAVAACMCVSASVSVTYGHVYIRLLSLFLLAFISFSLRSYKRSFAQVPYPPYRRRWIKLVCLCLAMFALLLFFNPISVSTYFHIQHYVKDVYVLCALAALSCVATIVVLAAILRQTRKMSLMLPDTRSPRIAVATRRYFAAMLVLFALGYLCWSMSSMIAVFHQGLHGHYLFTVPSNVPMFLLAISGALSFWLFFQLQEREFATDDMHVLCPVCEYPNDRAARVCPECGKPLPMYSHTATGGAGCQS